MHEKIQNWKLLYDTESSFSGDNYLDSALSTSFADQDLPTTLTSQSQLQTWYQDRAYLASYKGRVLLCALGWGIQGLFYAPEIFSNLFQGRTLRYDMPDACDSGLSIFFLPIGLINLILVLILAIKLRKTVDAFWIKAELSLLTTSFIIIYTFFFLHRAGTLPLGNPLLELDGLLTVLCVDLAAVFTLYVPVWKDYKEKKLSKGEVSTNTSQTSPVNKRNLAPAFRALLSDEEGIEAFQERLASEYAVENILFWRAVEKFREYATSPDVNIQKLRKEATSIYVDYIHEDARMLVNLSAEKFSAVRAVFEALSGTPRITTAVVMDPHEVDESADLHNMTIDEISEIFNVAQQEVFYLMMMDSFFRYQVTEEYQNLTDRIQTRAAKDSVVALVLLDSDDRVEGRKSMAVLTE
jgi:hypothetical protein